MKGDLIMPFGSPGLISHINKEALKSAIEELPEKEREFGMLIAPNIRDYLEIKNQTIPLGICVSIMISIFGIKFHYLLAITIFIISVTLTFIIRKQLLKSWQEKMIKKWGIEQWKLKVIDKLCKSNG